MDRRSALIAPLWLAAGLRAARGDGPAPIRVLTWNIWNGGDEARKDADPAARAAKQARVAAVIRASGADLVAMVETYGSGEAIARDLGFHFHPRGTNVSILSRWPIASDLSTYKPFHCVGALVERPDGTRVALYSVWIHYVDDIWTDPRSRDGRTPADLVARDGASRVEEVRAIAAGVADRTRDLAGVPVILAGDFNSNSHLDYTEEARDQFGPPVAWPVTRAVAELGYRDAYRTCLPRPDRARDRTWSPRFPDQIQDRIDYVFWRGDAIAPRSALRIDRAPAGAWPSDHAAVLVEFAARP